MAREEPKPALPSTLYDQDYFLTACEGHEEFVKTQGEHLSRRLSKAFAVASVEPGMRVLDVGCGRGEILRHCARLGADAYGIDYAEVAVDLSQDLLQSGSGPAPGKTGVYQADAKHLPFPSAWFDRVLMFDVVEHLYPWELDAALAEIKRVLKPGGMFVVHTAPNRWYDAYAYPLVPADSDRAGQRPPVSPEPARAQRRRQPGRARERAGHGRPAAQPQARGLWSVKVWLDTPPQHRREPLPLQVARHIAFRWPPFRWFFEREVFAVAVKV